MELIEIFNLENYRIGITGTNGKSTTTKFIEKSLNSMKINAIACGNIGIPISEVINRSNKRLFGCRSIIISTRQNSKT